MSKRSDSFRLEPTVPAGADPRLQRPAPPPPLVRTAQLVIWLGLAALLTALVWWGIARRLTWPPVIIGVVGVGGVLFWLGLNLGALRQAAGSRGAKLVLNSAAFVLLVAGILVMVNVVVARHSIRKDMTEEKLFSLSEQSMQVLSALPQEVKLIAFTPPGVFGSDGARRTVALYREVSPRVRVQWADETDVALAKQYDVTVPGTVVVVSGERHEKVTDATESRLTSAIMSVTTAEKTKVYFLTGHGEAGPSDGESSVAALQTDLTNQQYEVAQLDLARMEQPRVPADCGALVIMGARVPPTPEEMQALRDYLAADGKLFLALAPQENEHTPSFNELLSDYGVRVLPGTVVDSQSGLLGDPATLLVAPAAAGSPVVQGVDRVVLPLARPLQIEAPDQAPGPGRPPAPAQALFSSSPQAFVQASLQEPLQAPATGGQSYALAAVVDHGSAPSPLPGAPAPEETEGTRLVVVGSSLAFDDSVLRSFRFNGYLALNSIAWLTRNVRLISVPPKEEKPRRLLLTSTQKNFINFVVLLFIPLAVIVGGVSVWWIRRK